MYTVGRIKNEVLHLMREYSNAGEVENGDNVMDYKLSMIPLINKYQMQLARDTMKIKKEFSIAHIMPINLLGKYNFNENRVHLNDEINYIVNQANAYSFQVAGEAIIYIECYIDGEWIDQDTITNSSSTDKSYIQYKGKINPDIGASKVRIRFSGEYRYLFRWVALYVEKYPTNDDVPSYQPYLAYELPEDFYQLDKVDWIHEYMQFDGYADYKFDQNNDRRKQLYLFYYTQGEFRVHYYGYPRTIENITPANTDDNDEVALDIADEVCSALIYFIAADLKRDEDSYMSDVFLNLAYADVNSITYNDSYEQGLTGIIDTNGWC